MPFQGEFAYYNGCTTNEWDAENLQKTKQNGYNFVLFQSMKINTKVQCTVCFLVLFQIWIHVLTYKQGVLTCNQSWFTMSTEYYMHFSLKCTIVWYDKL